MPVQCNQGWLPDLRLCGPFSRRWRSFFSDTGTGGIAFPLQQHSFMPDTMRYYWFWIEMLILGTGQLRLRAFPAHFSFFTWLRWSVSMGRVNPQLSLYYNTLARLGKGLRACGVGHKHNTAEVLAFELWLVVEQCSFIEELKAWWQKVKPVRHCSIATEQALLILRPWRKNQLFQGWRCEVGRSALCCTASQKWVHQQARQIYMTGIKQHNQIVCATI